MRRSIVYVKFPNTGLGNMLLIWGRAVVFAHINQLELVTSAWYGVRWGAIIRKENKKRLYWKYFQESALYKRCLLAIYTKSKLVVKEPPIKKISEVSAGEKRIFLFDQVMTDADLFDSMRPYHQLIRDELYRHLHITKKNVLGRFSAPVIGIHVRRGDFKFGSLVTPISFFIEAIQLVRQVVDEHLQVTVFTDASYEELSELLSLPGVHLTPQKADILDILLLSKSQIIILSASSTFSYWSAFLSEALVIRPSNDWLPKIRDSILAPPGYFEMKWMPGDNNSTGILTSQLNRWKSIKTG